MATTIIKIPRAKTEELKGMVEDGLHVFGKVMSRLSQMCEEPEMGERIGMREMDYPYGDRMGMREDYDHMGERHYPMSPYGDRWEAYGDRRGVRGTGRYSMYN